jgi:urease beta subunit
MNGSEGFAQEQGSSDEISLGKISLLGVSGVAIDAGNALISNLATPVASTDAVNKGYVDALASGLAVKEPVKAVAVSAITLSGTQTVDGVSLVAGDRVLATAQADAKTNGIYVVAAGAWARSADADTAAEVKEGMTVFVQQGTDYADSQWVLITNSFILGTSDADFVQFSGLGQVVAGNGLTKTLNTMNVGAGNGIAVASDSVAVDLASNPGLQFTDGKLDAKPNTAKALGKDADGLYVKIDTSKSLAMNSSSGIQVIADSAKALAIDATNGLQVVADSNYGLSIDSVAGLRVDLAANKGLAMDSGDIAIDLATDPALQFTSGKLDFKPDTARALAKDSSGAYVKIDTAKAMAMDATNGIQVNVDETKAMAIDASAGIQVVVDTAKAIKIDSTSGLQVVADTAKAMKIDSANGLQVVVDTAKAMKIDATNGVQLVADADYGFSIDATSGLRLDLASGKGLQFLSGDLAIKLETDAALEFDAVNGGLEVKIANANHLSKDASGLAVVGLPSLFKVNGVATTANVTATNLNTLTGALAADSLHYHGSLSNVVATSGSIAAGKAVYFSANNTVTAAACGAAATSRVFGITAAASVANFVAVRSAGTLAGFSGLTAGTPYYLGSDGSPVEFSSLTTGDRVIRLGFGVNATSLAIMIQDMGQKA